MIVSNIIRRVFNVKYANSTATAFALDVENRQYLVTAKHVIEDAPRTFDLEFQHEDSWKTLQMDLVGHDPASDTSVMASNQLLTEANLVAEATTAGLVYGQDVYFLGFPLGLMGDHAMNMGFPLPFVKRATLSKFESVSDPILTLDGINNPGFSGGPVAFKLRNSEEWRIAGVISGYRYSTEPVYSGDQPTGLTHRVNTGLISASPISCALRLIAANPIGMRTS